MPCSIDKIIRHPAWLCQSGVVHFTCVNIVLRNLVVCVLPTTVCADGFFRAIAVGKFDIHAKLWPCTPGRFVKEPNGRRLMIEPTVAQHYPECVLSGRKLIRDIIGY